MTSNARAGGRILGSLRSADGKGIVRMEDRFDTDIDDLWSALTDPGRLARWIGEVEGDLRLGGEFRTHIFASGWESTGRVEACEPPQRLLVTTANASLSRASRTRRVIEATLTADGDQTVLVVEERGMPLDMLAWLRRRDAQIHVENLAAHIAGREPARRASRRAGRSSSLPTKTWRPTSASTPQTRCMPRLLELPDDPLVQASVFAPPSASNLTLRDRGLARGRCRRGARARASAGVRSRRATPTRSPRSRRPSVARRHP